jgi:phosphatidate phosphatase APP1
VTWPLLVTAIVVLLAVPAFVLPDLIRSSISDLILPPALGRPRVVWISGRVVNETSARGPRALQALHRLAARNWIGAPVTVRFAGQTREAISGHDGEFEVEIRAAEGTSFNPGAHAVEVEAPGVHAIGIVFVVPDDAPFIVVSDFDDTLAISHVTHRYRLLATTFFTDADTHPPVDGMAALYRAFIGRWPVAPAFAVVSGWPIQFAPRLTRFLEKHGYPPMALFLRNLGRATLTGYKEPILRRIVERFPHRLVLVGDSGERDPEIYAALAREVPGRVLRIYIREADELGPMSRFEGMFLFSDPQDAVRDATVLGLGA